MPMLDTKLGRIIYVGCVTMFLTTLGCWAIWPTRMDLSLMRKTGPL